MPPAVSPGEHRASGRPDDTNELVRRWQALADIRAREELCHRYLPLAHRLAGRYRTAHEPLEDLAQVASVALLGAIDRFDPDRGQSFVAFAIPTILGELKRYFRDVGWSTHVTRGAQELALRVDRASKELAARTGHAPRVKELATYLELDIDYVLAGLEASAAQYAVSLDAPAPSSKPGLPQLLGESLGDDDDGFGLVEAKLAMSSAIGRLPYLEREALRLRMEGSLKQIEIADQLGCSQMQVSRLLRRASATIRELTGQP